MNKMKNLTMIQKSKKIFNGNSRAEQFQWIK